MLRLYDYLPSQNGYKIRMLLAELGQAWKTIPLEIFRGDSQHPEFLAKNPAGAVPVLELESGETIAESSAILWYLAETNGFLPQSAIGRAKTQQWLSFEQYYVEPTIGSLRFWTLTGRLQQNQALLAGKRAAGSRALAALERHLALSSFIVAEGYGIADMAVFAYSHLAQDAGFDLAPYPAFRAWIERVKQRAKALPPVYPYTPDAHAAPPAPEPRAPM